MISWNIQFFGGRGASAGTGSESARQQMINEMLEKEGTRVFRIDDIDTDIIVEETTRKEILGFLDDYIDNFPYDWFDPSDSAFTILYKDGSEDYIGEGYDGHKVKKTNIESIVYDNPSTSMVYGNFEINEYGVVTPSSSENITDGITEYKKRLKIRR